MQNILVVQTGQYKAKPSERTQYLRALGNDLYILFKNIKNIGKE